MRRIKQASLDRLNLTLTAEDLIRGLRIDPARMELSESELRFPCPLHDADAGEPRGVRIDRATRYGWCASPRCPFNPGGSLLWLYARALRQDLSEVAEALAPARKLDLEYEFWIGEAAVAQTDAFAYVEARGAPEAPIEVVHVDDLAALVRLHPDSAAVNPLRFEVRLAEEIRQRRRQQSLPLLGNFYLLLRAAPPAGRRGPGDGLEMALADARFICRELVDRYRVPEEALSLHFCWEGLHLEVDHRIFGAQPDPHLARTWRRMAFLLGGVDEGSPARPLHGGLSGHPARCPTLAQEAYGPDFMWPCPGTRQGSPPVHKIWISLHELMEKDLRYLRELALEPRRPLDPPLRLSLERLARGLFLCALEQEARGGAALPLLGEDLPRKGGAASAPGARPQAAAPAQASIPAPARGAAKAGAAAAAAVPPGEAAAPAAAIGRGTAGSEGGGAGGSRAAAVAEAGMEEAMSSADASRSQGAARPGAAAGAAAAPAAAASGAASAPGRSAPVGPPPASAPAAAPHAAASTPFHPASSLADLMARLTGKRQGPIPITAFGSKTHPGDGLNQALQGGLHVGHVIGLAGATGEGKTTFALQMADGLAFDNVQRERDGQPPVAVLYLSGQARPEALLLKTLSRLAKLDSGDILRGRTQQKDLQEAQRIYQSFHRHLSVRPCVPDPDLAGARRALEEMLRGATRLAALFVDPLGALGHGEGADAGSGVRLLRRLGALARELPVAVVAVISTRAAGRGGPLDYAEELAPLAEWLDTLFGLKTDAEIDRAGGVMSLDERSAWKKEFKAELKRKADAAPLKRGGIDYRELWKSEYSVLMTLKSRWQNPVHSAYHFHKAVHRFEEI
jgi:hypothetical protein